MAAALFWYLRTRVGARSRYRAALAIGTIIGLTRGALSGLGFYGVTHTGGPLQIPAFALTMLSLPEAALILDGGGLTLYRFGLLSFSLLVGSLLFVGAVYVAVQLTLPQRTA